MAAILYPSSKDVMGRGCVENQEEEAKCGGGGGNEDRKKFFKLKGAQTCGAGCPVSFVHCPRTLDLDGFVD